MRHGRRTLPPLLAGWVPAAARPVPRPALLLRTQSLKGSARGFVWQNTLASCLAAFLGLFCRWMRAVRNQDTGSAPESRLPLCPISQGRHPSKLGSCQMSITVSSVDLPRSFCTSAKPSGMVGCQQRTGPWVDFTPSSDGTDLPTSKGSNPHRPRCACVSKGVFAADRSQHSAQPMR